MMLIFISYAVTCAVGAVVGIIVAPTIPDSWKAAAAEWWAKAKAWIEARL